ncbi:MATE family efflux transporter [Streptomyces sp. NPDC020858]|uniref:MATE family efflux transporter n=1 Tax=Streptomyces sp. NPDC020858 TaxID=3365097 RepID=UPI00378F5418
MAGTADSHRTAWPRRDRRRARRGTDACATAGPVLSLLGAPDDLIGPGAASLRAMAFAVPFAAVSFTLQGACAGIGATRVSMYTALNLPLGRDTTGTAEPGPLRRGHVPRRTAAGRR